MTTPLPPAVMAFGRNKVTSVTKRFGHGQGHLALQHQAATELLPGRDRVSAASPDIVTGTLPADRSSRLFASLWRLIGYGGRRCYACRTSLVTHHIPATGKHVCAKCVK
jgi:hypothetical protein